MFCIEIKEDLIYEILYFKVTSSENEINYTNFFFDLKEKGLEGEKLRMLTCDGKKAIENSFLFICPNKDIQICSVYYVKEALRYIKNKRLLPSIRKKTYSLYKSKTKDEFLDKLNNLKKEYENKESKFFNILLKNIDKTLTFYKYPEKFHFLIKNTNLIESFLRDIEQLTRYWAGFRDEKSVNRVIYLLVERFNKNKNNGGYSLFEFTQFY